jgi:hypothetical protein
MTGKPLNNRTTLDDKNKVDDGSTLNAHPRSYLTDVNTTRATVRNGNRLPRQPPR